MLPQWSPALSAGNGRPHRSVAATLAGAAMEPSLIGWEWAPRSGFITAAQSGRNGAQPYRLGMDLPAAARGLNVNSRNGAQPYRLGMAWKILCFSARPPCRNGAQPYRLGMVRQDKPVSVVVQAAMEPSLIGWEWPASGASCGTSAAGRNGAQPYRLGMVDQRIIASRRPVLPQWSPALSAGNGPGRRAGSAWRASGRNGAQPYRLGMAPASAANSRTSAASRNGAQPYRLGMARTAARVADR